MKPGCKCYDCQKPYPFGTDISLPNWQWDLVFPEGKGNGGGLLCPSCMCLRLDKLGATVVLARAEDLSRKMR